MRLEMEPKTGAATAAINNADEGDSEDKKRPSITQIES